MSLSKDFWSAVEQLRASRMGTELMGPLLYSLIRSLRPRSVVEAGMGYTSPFIAQALADNVDDFNAEILQLEAKLQLFEKHRQVIVDHQREDELRRFHMECLCSDPPLASPAYYCSEYKPIYYAIDEMTNKESSAPKVMAVLQQLNLLHVVEFHQSGFRAFL